MATETAPTSLQTGVTSSPISSNAQDFSDSDDDILDNFAAGPDPNDDGTPLGLGGEKGKQSEPASSTLEADIVSSTKQPGVAVAPEDSAGEREPVQKPAGEKGTETSPEPSEEPETPEFPPMLLQMAGLADAAAAQAAGFQSPEALLAAIKLQNQLLRPGVKSEQPSVQGLYRRPAQVPIATAPQQTAVTPVANGEVKQPTPFQLPAEKLDMLDEDLQAVLREMNQHYQQEVAAIRESLTKREADIALQKAYDEELQFDKAVQSLGEEWQDVFGEGSITELAQLGQRDPVAMTNFNHRQLLFEEMQFLRDARDKQGYKPIGLKEEVLRALMQRYPDKFQQLISGNSGAKSGLRPGVTASRPTQRKTPPKSQNDKLLYDVNAMLKKRHGYALSSSHEEEFYGDI